MGSHDDYGKKVLHRAAGNAYEQYGESVEIDYGAGQPARIDGAVANKIAVEVESRTSKQIRGAVLDLLCHRYQKKLLIILPVHQSNPDIAAEQCRFAMRKFLKEKDFLVIVLSGNGFDPHLIKDARVIKQALINLGFDETA